MKSSRRSFLRKVLGLVAAPALLIAGKSIGDEGARTENERGEALDVTDKLENWSIKVGHGEDKGFVYVSSAPATIMEPVFVDPSRFVMKKYYRTRLKKEYYGVISVRGNDDPGKAER